MLKCLMIDNYDSFTYNLVHYLEELGVQVIVFRNDEITIHEIIDNLPGLIVISPGPGRPEDSKISIEVIAKFYKSIPILGVCLGHQAIGHAFGADIVQAHNIMHGKTSIITNDGRTIFKNLPERFSVMRYHSLVINPSSLSSDFEVSSYTNVGEIMSIRHKKLPIEGIQFHPESIMTEYGKNIIDSFIKTYI